MFLLQAPVCNPYLDICNRDCNEMIKTGGSQFHKFPNPTQIGFRQTDRQTDRQTGQATWDRGGIPL